MLLRENILFFYDISQDSAGIRLGKVFFHAVSNGLFNIHANIIFEFISAGARLEFDQLSIAQTHQSCLNIGFIQPRRKRNKLFRCRDLIGVIDHPNDRNALDNSGFNSGFDLRERIVSL